MVRDGDLCRGPATFLHLHRRRPDVIARKLTVAALAAMLLAMPTTVVAAPTPSPSLESLLAGPPATDYKESSEPFSLHGAFGMDEYLTFLGPKDRSQTQKTLTKDGFVSGYSRTWVQASSDHLLLEAVIAFSGRAGARRWLGTSEVLDKADQYYKRAISVSGIDSYYGVHFEDPKTPAYADVVSFVKGNDYFLIGLVSDTDDLGDVATSQTRRQFDAAPPYTIPPSQWPESARSLLDAPRLASIAPYVFGGLAIIALLTGLTLFVLLRLRRRPAPAVVGASALHISPDGRSWWDGQAWRDASREIPPGALRSEDGNYWWDGAEWRLIDRSVS